MKNFEMDLPELIKKYHGKNGLLDNDLQGDMNVQKRKINFNCIFTGTYCSFN